MISSLSAINETKWIKRVHLPGISWTVFEFFAIRHSAKSAKSDKSESELRVCFCGCQIFIEVFTF